MPDTLLVTYVIPLFTLIPLIAHECLINVTSVAIAIKPDTKIALMLKWVTMLDIAILQVIVSSI